VTLLTTTEDETRLVDREAVKVFDPETEVIPVTRVETEKPVDVVKDTDAEPAPPDPDSEWEGEVADAEARWVLVALAPAPAPVPPLVAVAPLVALPAAPVAAELAVVGEVGGWPVLPIVNSPVWERTCEESPRDVAFRE
jgi:hypothetical protein